MVEAIVPLIDDAAPPVTRPITLPTVAGPLNVAVSPRFSPNWPKLWNKLPPTCLPRLAVIAELGPPQLFAGGNAPATAMCWAQAGEDSAPLTARAANSKRALLGPRGTFKARR